MTFTSGEGEGIFFATTLKTTQLASGIRFFRSTTFALALFAITLSSIAQPQRPRPQNDGPWNRDLVAFDSADGITFTNRRVFVERAGVPCVIRDGSGRLAAVFQWFPSNRPEAFDKVAVVFSTDDGKNWTKLEPIRVANLPEGAQRPFDPTLVLLDDKRLRLYFTCTTPERRTPGIYSAISTNGVDYVFEPGMRFGSDGEATVDPAVVRFGKTWHLYSPVQGPETWAYHATSDDGLNFRTQAEVNVLLRGSWIGNLNVQDDKLCFYGSGGNAGWLANSTNGSRWQIVSQNLRVGGDPAIVKLGEKKFLLIATGENRLNTSRATQPSGPPWNPPAPFRDP